MRHIITDYGVTPGAKWDQTEEIQKVLDKGGTIVFPKGSYLFSGVLMGSDTTLYLESGAVLLGSENCDDYKIFDVPEGVHLRTDMELIPQQYNFKPWPEYRRAMISAYGAKNIAVIGEPGSVIDGRDCYDPNGEEGYRGPHGIFLTNCENITLRGYTVQNSGNFMHQLDACRNTAMTDVTCLGGSDGIHLHFCENTEINRCVFRTGDDCVAGINIRDLHVNNCVMNTSCDAFRMGGVNILVENCHIYGPGYYPHRMTIVKSRDEILPREAGRHNLLTIMLFFASETFPAAEHSHNIVFRNLIVENPNRVVEYYGDNPRTLHAGDRLRDVTFDNVLFTGVVEKSIATAPEDEPLTVYLKNTTVTYKDRGKDDELFDGNSCNVKVIKE